MNTDPPDKINISWEENTMRVREKSKLVLSHLNDELYSILDPFFKLVNQVDVQMISIMQENKRLIEILEKNKIDYAPEPPKPLTTDQTPAKTIEEAAPGAPPPNPLGGALPKPKKNKNA